MGPHLMCIHEMLSVAIMAAWGGKPIILTSVNAIVFDSNSMLVMVNLLNHVTKHVAWQARID
jgi:hypothetical protein